MGLRPAVQAHCGQDRKGCLVADAKSGRCAKWSWREGQGRGIGKKKQGPFPRSECGLVTADLVRGRWGAGLGVHSAFVSFPFFPRDKIPTLSNSKTNQLSVFGVVGRAKLKKLPRLAPRSSASAAAAAVGQRGSSGAAVTCHVNLDGVSNLRVRVRA